MGCGVLGAVSLQWLDAAPRSPLDGAQPSRQLCSERNAKQRRAELLLRGREKVPGPEFGGHLSLSCAGELLAAALCEAALLGNNFLLCSNIVEIMPLRN